MEREGQHPLDVCPLEIWQEIFNHLTQPDDLVSCYSATRTWRDLLQRKKTSFHSGTISKVFSIIDANIGLSPYTILACRRVCSAWKAGIDRFLQLHPRHTDIGFAKTPPQHILKMNPYRHQLPTLTFKTEDPLKFLRFLQTLDLNPTLNPLFSRSVTYYESFLNLPHDHRLNATLNVFLNSRRQGFATILDRVGTQIWHATLHFTDDVAKDESSLYIWVRIYLENLPNLRSLSILIEGNKVVGNFHNMTEHFQQQLKTSPLPPLNHLVFLSMRNVPNPLQTGLLTHYATNVKTLSFQNKLWRPSFPPESNIIMEGSRMEELKTFMYCHPDLFALQASGWPLKCLHLRWIQPSDLDLIFGALSSFSKTLHHLRIEFRGARAHNFEKFRGILNLPYLETIKITTLHSHLSNIDFLSGCPALKELEVDMWLPLNKETSAHVIQFDDHIGSMQLSNIWGIMRSLKKIKIRTVSKGYQRDGFNIQREVWVEKGYEYFRP